MVTKDDATYTVSVFIAGDLADARRSLRRQCLEEGLCVTLTPTQFVYTAGVEDGVEVGLRQYPRFPKQPAEIWDRAVVVATRLMDDLCQQSAMLVSPQQTRWLTKRPADQPTTK